MHTETLAPTAPETHHFGADVARVLRLMIHSLYTHKDIFLRELVSNASDACDKLRYAALTAPDLLEGGGALGIRIQADKAARTLTITDNGIGMSRQELAENLGTIARSGTQEFLAHLGEGAKESALIGQFGVGFYSAFMVAEKVSVVSTRAGQAESWVWESTGEGSFTLRAAEQPAPRGTCITLHLRAGEEEYLDPFRLRHIVQTYSDHVAFPIEVVQEDGRAERANSGSALWTRPKKDITPEHYQEFYRHTAHSPEEPFLTLHVQAEGTVAYTALLFVPGIAPFDLLNPDRARRVKLYIKRVFIAEEGVELIPRYLRFLRGVIDAEDLPLNISRETLQASPVLAKIRDSACKRVLSELKKKAEADPTGYATFWQRFGAVLKEGLCEAHTPREAILDVCRFHSTKAEELVSLAEYASRMPAAQEAIYYLIGSDIAQLRHSPQLEGFAARGLEVLLLADHVDDFWLSLPQEYQGKSFVSITSADLALPPLEGENAAPAHAEGVLKRFQDVLGDAVAAVRASNRLVESPVRLAVEEGAMSGRMERFLMEQQQLSSARPKVLEVNLRHPILRTLEGASPEAAERIIWLLFDQARLLEGEPPLNPTAFAQRLTAVMGG